nr:ATP-binding protein [Streptomyces albospinus]
MTITRPAETSVRIAVADKSQRAPEFAVAGDSGETGRGLAVIDALSCRWGTDRLPWGKRVRAELAYAANS